LHKSDVAGLVLVDPSFTNQGQMWKASVTPEQWNAERVKKAAVLDSAKDCYKQSLVKTLLSAIKAASEQLSLCLDNPPNNDPVVHAELNREWASPKFWATNISETENAAPDEGGLSTDDREMPVEPPRFGALPMMILTRWGAPTYWNVGHRALAAASTEGSNVTIRFSGHRIQDDQPGAVVDAISNVVERVRSHAQPK
jgi:hypothetical protein